MRASINELKNSIMELISNGKDIEDTINQSIEIIGKYFNVDRVYIFENSDDDLICNNTFEWCNEGITPEKDNLQGLRYLEDMGGEWIDNYNEDGLFFCPTVSKLPVKQREILEPQGIFSMLQCAIRERGEFKGYIGFDNCQDHLGGWEYDKDAVDALVFSSRVLSLYLLEYRNKSKIIEYTKRLEEQNSKMERFMGYVCKANESVLEVNLVDFTSIEYRVNEETGRIETVKAPFMNHHYINYKEQIQPVDYAKIVEAFDEKAMDEMLNTVDGEKYFECRSKDVNGEYKWYSYNLQAIPKSQDYPRNFIMFKKNIDEAKIEDEHQKMVLKDALDAAKEASEAKGSFLSNMSHEIRTPLNAIIGYLTLARDEDASQERIKHCIDNSEVASKHLLQIINDILDMSAIESGKLKIAHEEFDLKKEISDVTTIFFQNAKLKGVNFETHIVGLTNEWVKGDQLRLNQIIINLLSNAVKFTPTGGDVNLYINQKNEENDSVYIEFVVSDTGIGMSEEYMSRLFHPFEQEDASIAKKYGGSGLGLSITNNLISMMNGKIDVTSKQNEGTEFKVILKFGKSHIGKETEKISIDYSHLRALVVDDQKDECTYVKEMLKKCGVKADTVTSGAMALKRIKSRKGGEYEYSFCIIDWNMPDMNGIEVTKNIREILGDNTPVIIATAYDVASLIDEAKAAGVTQVVPKPLFQSTLFDIIVNTFGKYNPDAQDEAKFDKETLKGLHVLLAEDNDMNMEIAVTVLEKIGIIVEQAHDGQEAYDKFYSAKPGTYDLILMDIQMPVLDGYGATKKIRDSDATDAKNIPIIAMTANAFAEDVAEALSKGMNAHISKPVNYSKLFDVLQKFSHCANAQK